VAGGGLHCEAQGLCASSLPSLSHRHSLSHQKYVLIPSHTSFFPGAQEPATAHFIEIQPLLLVALRINLSFCSSYLISQILNISLGKKKNNKKPFSVRLGIQGLKQKQCIFN